MATATTQPTDEAPATDAVVDPQASLQTTEWAAAQAFAAPFVATQYTERKRTYDLMVSGAPMYGVSAP